MTMDELIHAAMQSAAYTLSPWRLKKWVFRLADALESALAELEHEQYAVRVYDYALKNILNDAEYSEIQTVIAKEMIQHSIDIMPDSDFKKFIIDHGGAEWHEGTDADDEN